MNRKALDTIRQYDMFQQGDTVIAAVSGGADSVALLDLLCHLFPLRLRVRACHLNHCLRGAESNRDERLVRTMCREYGVPLDVQRVDVDALSKQRKISVEQAAREARYTFFAALAETHSARVATGHTLSDTTETVILNLARGTGLTGLRGIPPVRDFIVRPLLACTRAETEAYCYSRGLYFVIDRTNFDDRYTRNYIRHTVMPDLMRVSEGAERAIGRMTTFLAQDADYLATQAQSAYSDCARADGLDAAKTAALHPALRGRVIGLLLEREQLEREHARIRQILSLLEGGCQAVSAGRGVTVRVQGGVLRVERISPKPKPPSPRKIAKTRIGGRQITLEDGKRLVFSRTICEDYEIFKNNTDWDLKYVADYDKIKTDVLVRARQAGDRFRPPGRGCSKTLKKLFCELKIPDRDSLCVVADEAGVIFCESVGIDERVAPDAQTKRLVYFEMLRRNETDVDGGQTK